MADDEFDEFDRDAAMAALERLRLRGVAFIAEHYVPHAEPMTDEEFIGSMSDPEYVWHLSMEHALGSYERWEAFAAACSAAASAGRVLDEDEIDEDFMEMVAETIEAHTAVFCLAIEECQRLNDEARLFDHVTPAPLHSPAWAPMFALEVGSEEPELGALLLGRGGVATYLYNVRDGMMDATGAFLDFDDDE